MTAAQLLKDAWTVLARLWPVVLVRDWQQGVLLRGGQAVRTLRPGEGVLRTGFYAFLPLLHEVRVEGCATEVQRTPTIDLQFADGAARTAVLAAELEVYDVALYYVSLRDRDESVVNALCGIAATAALRHVDLDEWLGQVQKDAEERLGGWGVRVREVELASLCAPQMIRLIRDGASASVWEDEGD